MASKITIDTTRLLPAAGQTSAGGGAIVKSSGGGIVRSLGRSFSGAVQEISNVKDKQQGQTLTFLSKQLQAINSNILAIGNNITALTSALQEDTRQEEENIQQTRISRIRSAEKESFGRAENILENRIVRAIAKPVKKITGAVAGGLSKLKDALMLLFVGWLGDKIFKMFQAKADGNEEEFNGLAKEVGIALLAAGGAFLALNGGLLGIMATIGGIATSVAGFLLTQPFKWLKNLFLPAKPPVTGGGRGSKPPVAGGGGGGRVTNGRGGTPGLGGGKPPVTTSGGNPAPRPGLGGVFDRIKGGLGRMVPGPIKNNAKRLSRLFARPKAAVAGLGKGIMPFLGRLLGVATFGLGVRNRINGGQSPTQAVLGYLPEFLLTYGGAKIGLGAGTLAGGGILSALTAIAGAGLGGMIGGMLGQPITNLIDNSWNPEWDKALGFINDPITKFLGDTGIIDKPAAAAPTYGTEGINPRTNLPFSESPGKSMVEPTALVVTPFSTTDSRGADLAQRGPVEGQPTMIDLTGGLYNKGNSKRQVYPSTTGKNVPYIPTSDPANPFRDFAKSIYNIAV